MKNLTNLKNKYYFFPTILLVLLFIVNLVLQPNLIKPSVFNGLLKTYLPLIFLAMAQIFVVISGGIDLSAGAIVSLTNVLIAFFIAQNFGFTGVILALTIATLAGLLNGVLVSYARFQPLITTFATSWIFVGIALIVMPSPGGNILPILISIYNFSTIVPFTVASIIFAYLFWIWFKNTKVGSYLFAVGGSDISAYISAVPVDKVRILSYTISGLFSGISGLLLSMSIGIGDALIGKEMTLNSVVAIVLGGSSMSGGKGGMFSAICGVLIIAFIRNIISFSNIDNWWQTFIFGLIVMISLASPGIYKFIKRGDKQ